MSIARCYSFLVLTFALFPPSSASGASRAEVEIDQQIERFIKTLRSVKLREMAKEHAGAYKKEDRDAACDAIDFFYDLKAKDVLFALLFYSYSPLWNEPRPPRLSSTIMDKITTECLDIFGIEDFPRLYETALRYRGKFGGGDDFAFCFALTDRLTQKTSALLGIEHIPVGIRKVSDDDKLAWWLKAVKTAKAKGSCPSDLDAVVKYFEKLEEEERKKPKEK